MAHSSKLDFFREDRAAGSSGEAAQGRRTPAIDERRSETTALRPQSSDFPAGEQEPGGVIRACERKHGQSKPNIDAFRFHRPHRHKIAAAGS
jgi:hypothetical protein